MQAIVERRHRGQGAPRASPPPAARTPRRSRRRSPSASSPRLRREGGKVGQTATFHERRLQRGLQDRQLRRERDGRLGDAPSYDATCTTPITTHANGRRRAARWTCASRSPCPAGATEGASSDTTFVATSTGDPTVSASATLTTLAVASTRCWSTTTPTTRWTPRPTTRTRWTPTAWTTACGTSPTNPELPASYLALHKNVVWFTGNTYPAPITPYESDAQGAPGQWRPAVHVGSGHPRPGGRHDGVRP